MDKQTLLTKIAELLDQYECQDGENINFIVGCEITFTDDNDEIWSYNGVIFERCEE